MESILSNNVLVLNRLWQAVNVCSVRRAFMLLYQGHAQVVEAESGSFQTMTFDQWHSFSRGYQGSDVVSTVSFKIRVPKVILLLFFDRMPKKEVKFTRHNIFERDHNTCQYCGYKFDRKDLNLDHVVPRIAGAKHRGKTSSVRACRVTAARATAPRRRRACACCIARAGRSGAPCSISRSASRATIRGSISSILPTGTWS